MYLLRESENARSFMDTIALTVDPDLRVESPIVGLAMDAWDRLRGTRAMPAPADIDAVKLPVRLLPHLLLMDLEYQPAFRLRWRLIGTHITSVVDRDMTGRYWDEIYDARAFEALTVGPLWVIEHRRPVRILGTAHYASKDYIRSESVDMPLSSDGLTIDRIMTVTVYDAP
ncbi:PAS domain-containing protein [Thalassobaculum sp.]|uniref:PAS domain-containing protein n=1 Tax=Thalassobaculum sp. TaxID=2022740 RepID=UPI0032EF064B